MEELLRIAAIPASPGFSSPVVLSAALLSTFPSAVSVNLRALPKSKLCFVAACMSQPAKVCLFTVRD